MEKNGHLKTTLIFLFCIALNLSSYSQIHKYFIITGKIISESAFIDQGTVQIIKKGKPAICSEIPKHGRFRLELDYNSEYRLIFSQNGFLPKTIKVNTDIPAELNESTTNFDHFLMTVRLYKDTQDADNLYSGDIFQQVNFSAEQNNFVRIPTIFDQEFVEKENSNQSRLIQSQESKSKLQIYHVF